MTSLTRHPRRANPFWFSGAPGAGGAPPSTRPAPIPHAAIAPPFDQADASGDVHTVLPPEQVIPPHFTDPVFIRADFAGVTLEGDYEPKHPHVQAAGGVTITSGRWSGLRIPFLVGANTTPATMIMTPMLLLYPRDVQDAVLTEHAERGYDDLCFDPRPWSAAENGRTFSPGEIVQWSQYLKSWGFRTLVWYGGRPPAAPDALTQTLFEAGVVNFWIHGGEVDEVMISEEFDVALANMDAYVQGRIPLGVHFTCDGARQMGYPIGFPRDTFLNNWAPYDGRVHLMQQMDGNASAGLQGASMYYARLHINCGHGDAAVGPGAPKSRIIAFETMATQQLYGQCSEEYGCLRSWEMLCGTRHDPRALPVSGSGNGIRYPDGTPL